MVGRETREREKQRDRETERQRGRRTERQRQTETDRDRQRNRETERQRDRETERQRDRETERPCGFFIFFFVGDFCSCVPCVFSRFFHGQSHDPYRTSRYDLSISVLGARNLKDTQTYVLHMGRGCTAWAFIVWLLVFLFANTCIPQTHPQSGQAGSLLPDCLWLELFQDEDARRRRNACRVGFQANVCCGAV
jgi:hypothetical protein